MRLWKKLALCILTVAISGPFTHKAYAVTAKEQEQIVSRLLDKVGDYDYGSSRAPLTELSDLIRSRYKDPQALKKIEQKFIVFLRSPATAAAKQFVCRQLSIIGTKESTGTLAAMLNNPATSDMARYALERIPDDAAGDALRRVVRFVHGNAKTGVITSLGVRRDAKSVPVLAGFITNSDEQVARATLAALGQIGNSEAAKVLSEAREKVSGDLKRAALDAYLVCAGGVLAGGDWSQALSMYRELFKKGNPATIRTGALLGMVSADQKKAATIIIDAIKSGDKDVQPAAIAMVRSISDPGRIKTAAGLLPKLSTAGQVQLLTALNSPGHVAARQVVINAAKSDNADVRIAAFKTLVAVGDESAVGILAKAATQTSGAEQDAARNSLSRLSGAKVDKAIIDALTKADAGARIELIRAIRSRNMTDGTKALLKTAEDADKRVRIESLRALSDVAGGRDIEALIDMLAGATGSTERKETEKAIVSDAQRTGRQEAVAGQIARSYSAASGQTRISYLRLLGTLGGPDAAEAISKALTDANNEIKDAAIRALAAFPSGE
ncbi:MAG: HEAT repeat domain-containing protein, partial [Planctomycetes bacterium]|nr:HEAT repeat domain-containing protein [Planctomycetota bacterium]